MKQRKRKGNIRTKQKSRLADIQSLLSGYNRIAVFLRAVDRNIIVFLILIITFLFLGTNIKLNMKTEWPAQFQIEHMNPDARLYYSIAENIVDGTGYFDTVRNEQTVPSVGHPLLLAVFCVILDLSPATFTWLSFMMSYVLLALAVWIYCRSNLLVLLALWLFAVFLKYITWLSANVESSIVFANLLLVFSLAILYKSNFRLTWALLTGIALAVNILIRPLFLPPTHLCLLILLAVLAYQSLRKHKFPVTPWVKSWIIVLVTVECIIWATYGYSILRYKDSRLVTGTYGGLVLYAGNNIHLPPDKPFITKKKNPEEFYKIMRMIRRDPTVTWQQRQKIIMQEVKNYWKEHPIRAIRGWWWRFRQFLGICSGNFSFKNPILVLHTFSTSVLLVLIFVRIVLVGRLKRQGNAPLANSLGLVAAMLFLLYSAIHAVFAYSNFRYVTPAIPFLVAADIILLYETVTLLKLFLLPVKTTKKGA